MALAFSEFGNRAEAKTIIPKGTLVKINLDQTLSSKTSRKGEMVHFSVVEAVKLGKTTVIKKGALCQAQITQVRGPGRFGKNGSIRLNYLFVVDAKKQQVPVTLGERAMKTNRSMGLAAGASAGGFIILGPVGLLGGAFVKGEHIEIPRNTQLLIEVAEDFHY